MNDNNFRRKRICSIQLPWLGELPRPPHFSRHPEMFPVDINKAPYELILRVPGIGVKSATLIVNSRRFGRVTGYHLKKMGVVMKKAKFFITCGELVSPTIQELHPENVRRILVAPSKKKRDEQQLLLPFSNE